ncbi:tetratricopeptide repeat protein 28-like isoform X2 [Oculina patagonica]
MVTLAALMVVWEISKKPSNYHERSLKIAKEVGDTAGEGHAYGNLGNAYLSLGDFRKAIECHEYLLKITKEVEDRAGEGSAYGNLGNAYLRLGDYKKAIECSECYLKIAKEVGDETGEGRAYGILGNAYLSLGDFKKAIEYHEHHLIIAQKTGDRCGEGGAYGSLGISYRHLGDFRKAIEFHERSLKIAKKVLNRAGEGGAYGNLGFDYHCLGDFKKAIEYYECGLKISKEVGRCDEGGAYGNLGIVYHSLGDFRKAIEHHERHLKIAIEVEDTAGEGCAYSNLGIEYFRLGDYKKAIEYHERALKIAKETGDRAAESKVYGNLGSTYALLRDFKKAIEYEKSGLKIAREIGETAAEAALLNNLGQNFELEGLLIEALDCYYSSVRKYNDVRHRLLFNDEWKISYRNMYSFAYTSLWRLLLKQGEVIKALFAAEQARAQALQDLMNLKYASESVHKTEEITYDTFSCLPSTTVFLAIDEREIIFWTIRNGKDVHLRRQRIGGSSSEDVATTVAESLIHSAYGKIGLRDSVKCEDRSLDRLSHEDLPNKKCSHTISEPTEIDTNPLRALYDVIIGPIFDLIHGNELILVPEGPLCLAPYAAFLDFNLKYLSDAFKIRVIPSLSSLKLLNDCSADYHKKSGALLVGDPCLEEVLYQGERLMQLPCAKAEVEMIGELLQTAPLTGKEATKDEVLRRLPSVALVHIAAHGRMETGEIALAPSTTRVFQSPSEEDFLLTMKDVLRVQLRARLVVLSCCHSGRGEIKSEGVVGIARAFLGAGARSVLVSLWAIDDEATLEFMKSFYQHLAEGRSASEALNRAMKFLRDSDEFNEVKYWAPFVLIGDDVTLDLDEGD